MSTYWQLMTTPTRWRWCRNCWRRLGRRSQQQAQLPRRSSNWHRMYPTFFSLILECRRSTVFSFSNKYDGIPTPPSVAFQLLPSTAYARSEDRVRALRAGFHIHLAKPIDPAELVTTIAALAKRFEV